MDRVVTFILVAVLSTVLTAQQPAPAFEIASVRPNVSDTPPSMLVPSQGTVAITNIPLINIITNAYAMPPFRILGVPEWVQRERFDITAKSPDSASPNQLAMLRTLLEDRFKLRVHRESGEQPAYALLIARTDGRLGPRLKRAATDCSTANFTVPSADSPCARGFMGVGPTGGTIVTTGQPLARMISALSMAVNRSVVDRTGLDGPFDAELRWSSDVNTTSANSDAPSIFTALQEQLGLKLESTRAAVEVLVIDSVERPTPD